MRYGCKVDIYAAGVVLYMALLGKLPFSASDTRKLASLVCSPHEFPNFQSKDGTYEVSKSCRECLSMMLEKDPNRRCSALQATRHPWLQNTVPRKRALPKPIPQEVRSSAAEEAQAAAVAPPQSPEVHSERLRALEQARNDWEEALESDESSESESSGC